MLMDLPYHLTNGSGHSFKSGIFAVTVTRNIDYFNSLIIFITLVML